jgi:hypothetical protein
MGHCYEELGMADPKSIKFPSKSNADNPSADIITVVRDPEHVLGKRFTLTEDGRINKQATVQLSFGFACMHQVGAHEELSALIKEVGEQFLILSERQIEERLSIPRNDRERQAGVHTVEYNGNQYKAVGRFKANVRPSCRQYLDRDIDEHTPANFASMSLEEWRKAVGRFLPGFDDVTCIHMPSTSSRVLHKDTAVGGGNGHVWFRTNDPSDIERFRTAVIVQAANVGMTWRKPRFSRTDPQTVVGQSLTTIIDPSVFTPGRLTFVGQPMVSEGLSNAPQSVTVHQGEHDAFDTATVALPDEDTVKNVTRKAGVEMQVKGTGNPLVVSAHDLTLDTEIETEDQGTLTVRECVENGITQKIRCQTPFRASSSFAAFLDTGQDGTPFVHDVGTGITHWLSQSEHDDLTLARAKGVCARLLEQAKTDSGAPFEPDAIDALIDIRKINPAEYQRIRTNLKKANRAILVTALDKAVQQKRLEEDIPETHHGFAQDLIRRLTVDGYTPIGHDGQLYTVDQTRNLWIGRRPQDLTRMVAESYDGLANCKRSGDYSSIAQLAVALASDPDFFTDAPNGLACTSGFYHLNNHEVMIEPLSPHHRQRVQLGFDPAEKPTPSALKNP